MAETNEDWAIEHVEEQQYDLTSLLTYDAKDVEVWGPNVSDPNTVEQDEWRETFEAVGAGQRIRVALTPRQTGTPASCRLNISWADASEERRSEWYDVPIPGRTRPDLRSPVPPGFATRAANARRSVGPRQYAGSVSTPNQKDVFVVHGRNEAARQSMFAFLRAIGLNPRPRPPSPNRTTCSSFNRPATPGSR